MTSMVKLTYFSCKPKMMILLILTKWYLPQTQMLTGKDELYPFFINEAAYYEKGFGFASKKMHCRILVVQPITAFAIKYINYVWTYMKEFA